MKGGGRKRKKVKEGGRGEDEGGSRKGEEREKGKGEKKGGGRKRKEQCSLELSSSMEAEEEREVENFLRPSLEPDPEGRRRSARLGLCEGV